MTLLDNLTNIPFVILFLISFGLLFLALYVLWLFNSVRTRSQNLAMSKARYVDIILLGPRYSGKTALTLRWATPWEQINDLSATPLWRTAQFTIHEMTQEEPVRDELLFTKRKQIVAIKGQFHDYPGEKEMLKEAVSQLSKIDKNQKKGDKTCLLLLMGVGSPQSSSRDKDFETVVRENADYYSNHFQDAFRQLKGFNIDRIFIVFNKKDLLIPAFGNDSQQNLNRLKEANKPAIEKIKEVLNLDPRFHLVSANTNEGIVDLLGQIGISATDGEESQKFKEHFARVREWEETIRS